MDLSSIKPADRKFEIKHPATDDELGVTITLMSYDDDRMKKIRRNIQDRRLHLEARGKHFKAEEIDENANALCFSAMLGWEWRDPANFRGLKPEFNRMQVFEVFKELPWFRDQIDVELGNEKSFFTASK